MTSPHVSLLARARALVLRRALDLQLAAGADPCSSADLTARAAQLRSARTRQRIARQLRRAITRSDLTPLTRSEIFEESDALISLARRLEDARPVEAMGVALANLIANDRDDRDDPLIVGRRPGTLHTTVRLASIALDVSPRAAVTERFLKPSPAGGHPRSEHGTTP